MLILPHKRFAHLSIQGLDNRPPHIFKHFVRHRYGRSGRVYDDRPAVAILSVLGCHVKRLLSVKFFITGRPEPRIRTGFRPPLLGSLTWVFLRHKVKPSSADEGIRLYRKRTWLGFQNKGALSISPTHGPMAKTLQLLQRNRPASSSVRPHWLGLSSRRATSPTNVSSSTLPRLEHPQSHLPCPAVLSHPQPHSPQREIAQQRQWFDHRRDDPVRFYNMARVNGSSQITKPPTPSPRSSVKYVFASSLFPSLSIVFIKFLSLASEIENGPADDPIAKPDTDTYLLATSWNTRGGWRVHSNITVSRPSRFAMAAPPRSSTLMERSTGRTELHPLIRQQFSAPFDTFFDNLCHSVRPPSVPLGASPTSPRPWSPVYPSDGHYRNFWASTCTEGVCLPRRMSGTVESGSLDVEPIIHVNCPLTSLQNFPLFSSLPIGRYDRDRTPCLFL